MFRLQRENPWLLPWTREMKDHCIERYASALRRQVSKTKKTEEQRCAQNPACTNMCTLKTGPAPSEDAATRGPSRRSSAKNLSAADMARAQAASEHQSAQLLQQAAAEVKPQPAASIPAPGDVASSGTTADNAAAAVVKQEKLLTHGEELFPRCLPKEEPKETQETDAALPKLDKACTMCAETGVRPTTSEESKGKEEETQEERHARHESAAAGLFRSVVQEATGNQVSNSRTSRLLMD